MGKGDEILKVCIFKSAVVKEYFFQLFIYFSFAVSKTELRLRSPNFDFLENNE